MQKARGNYYVFAITHANKVKIVTNMEKQNARAITQGGGRPASVASALRAQMIHDGRINSREDMSSVAHDEESAKHRQAMCAMFGIQDDKVNEVEEPKKMYIKLPKRRSRKRHGRRTRNQ